MIKYLVGCALLMSGAAVRGMENNSISIYGECRNDVTIIMNALKKRMPSLIITRLNPCDNEYQGPLIGLSEIPKRSGHTPTKSFAEEFDFTILVLDYKNQDINTVVDEMKSLNAKFTTLNPNIPSLNNPEFANLDEVVNDICAYLRTVFNYDEKLDSPVSVAQLPEEEQNRDAYCLIV